MSTAKKSGCEHCNKSTLSLLLLRPSPVANDRRMMAVDSGLLQANSPYVSGLTPKRQPTESRFGLRLLREGYVHVYIPNAKDAGVKEWQVWRVNANADLIAHTNPVFSQQPEPKPCSRKDHNPMGMRLLPIAQAHKIPVIWIAYSANLWNDKLKAQNKANPEAMQEVRLTAPGTNSFQPTAQALKSQVLEFAVSFLEIGGSREHDFPFVWMKELGAEAMAQQLTAAAACHPKTQGHELAVVLRDPVGVATELNALRLRRHEISQQYLLKPGVRQPLEVNKIIGMLKSGIISDIEEKSLKAVSPGQTYAAFEASKNYPPGTEWEELTPEERQQILKPMADANWLARQFAGPLATAYSDPDLGRVIFPDHEERAQAWAKAESDKAWAKMLKYYDEDKRAKWQEQFEADMKRLHYEPLKRFEADWDGALNDTAFKNYFELHFDEDDPNSRAQQALKGCSAGSVYCREAWLSYTPEPLTEVPAKTYLAQLDADIAQPDAIMLRAVFANQKSLGKVLLKDERDKVYDFMKELLGDLKDAKATGGKPITPSLARTVSWLTDITLGFSAGLVSTLGATAASSLEAAVRGKTRLPIAPEVLARLERAQAAALVHRASEEALKAAQGGLAPNVPVVMTAKFDADTARKILQGQVDIPASTQTARRRVRKGGGKPVKKPRISIAFITDTDTIAKLNVAPGKAIPELIAQASTVEVGERAVSLKRSSLNGAAAGTMLTLPADKFLDIYQTQRAQIARASENMGEWLKANGRAARHTAMSFDGRLAIGSMVVQGLGVLDGLAEYDGAANSGDAQKLLDARLKLADGATGFLGGFFELATAGWQARLAFTVGSGAAQASAAIPFLRGAAYGMGFAGNVVNAWMAFRMKEKLEKEGNTELAKIMIASTVFFILGAVPLFLVTADWLAKAAIRRGLIAAGGRVTGMLARAVDVMDASLPPGSQSEARR